MPTLAQLAAQKRLASPGQPVTPSSAPLVRGPEVPEAESTLRWTLRQVAKPGAATAGLVGGFLEKDLDEGLSRAAANLTGDRQDQFADVLEQQGMAPGLGRSALGFGLDVVADPLNLVPVGGIVKGAKVVGRGIGAAADVAKAVPILGRGVRLAEDAGRYVVEGTGEIFDRFHSLRDNPAYQQKRRLLDSERHAVADNEWHRLFERYKGTTQDERRAILQAIDKGEIPADSRLAKMVREQQADNAALFEEEVAAKVLRPEQKIENYAPYARDGKVVEPGTEFKDVSASDRFARRRESANLAQAIGGGAEPDAALAHLMRFTSGKRAALNGRFMLSAAEEFGDSIPRELFEAASKGDKSADAAIRQMEKSFRDDGLIPLKDIAGEPALKEALAGAWVPKNIADDLAKVHEAPVEPGKFGQLADAVTQKWRTWATVVRPGFHFTNFAGNVYNAALGGQRLAHMPKNLWAGLPGNTIPDVGGISGSVIEEYMGRHGMSHVGSAFGDELGKEGLGKALDRALDSTAAHLPSAYTRGMSKVGSVVENTSKRAFFLDQLQQKAAQAGGLTAKDLDAAMLATKDALFDYRELSDADRKIRRVIPFWTWTRKNVPLQIKGSLTRPQVPATLAKAQNAIEDATEAEGIQTPQSLRPDYYQKDAQVQLPFTLKDGSRIFLNPYLPVSDFNKLPLPGGTSPGEALAELGASLTPALKVPLEIAANRSFFTGRPLYNEQLGLTGDYQPAPAFQQLIPAQVGEALGLPVDPRTGRYMQSALANILTEGFLPLHMSGGKAAQAILDPGAASNPLAWTGFATPAKLTARSPEQTVRDAKSARTSAKRKAAAERKQEKFNPLAAALLKEKP